MEGGRWRPGAEGNKEVKRNKEVKGGNGEESRRWPREGRRGGMRR